MPHCMSLFVVPTEEDLMRLELKWNHISLKPKRYDNNRSVENTQRLTTAPLCVVTVVMLVNCRYLLPISWVG